MARERAPYGARTPNVGANFGIQTLVEERLYDAVRAGAKAEGLSVSAYVRRLLNRAVFGETVRKRR